MREKQGLGQIAEAQREDIVVFCSAGSRES